MGRAAKPIAPTKARPSRIEICRLLSAFSISSMSGISFTPRVEGKSNPILSTFVQGPPQSEDSLSFVYLQGAQAAKAYHRVLLARSNSESSEAGGLIRFEARSVGESSTGSSALAHRGSTKFLLGVFSKKRKRLDIYEPEGRDGSGVFGLNLTSSGTTNKAAAVSSLEGVGNRERRDVLISSFGSRKKKALERSKAANIVDVHAITAATEAASVLRSSAKASATVDGSEKLDDRSNQALMKAREALLPPFDPSATEAPQAYPIDGIILSADRAALTGMVSSVFKALRSGSSVSEMESAGGKLVQGSKYALDLFSRISDQFASGSVDERSARDRLRALFFLRCLIRLYSAPKELRVKKSSSSVNPAECYVSGLHDVPSSIADHLLGLFTERRSGGSSKSAVRVDDASDGEHFVRTPDLIDRLGCYIGCVSLFCEGMEEGSLDIRPIASDMALSNSKLMRYYRELGCSIVSSKGSSAPVSSTSNIVALRKLPLSFPKPKHARDPN